MFRRFLTLCLTVASCVIAGATANGQPALFTFQAESLTAGYDPVTGTGSFSVALSVRENAGSPGAPNDTQGFSMAFAYDPAFLAVTDAVPVGEIAQMDASVLGPAFFGANLDAPSEPGELGVTIGVVFDFFGEVSAQFGVEKEVVDIAVQCVPTFLIGNQIGASTTLEWKTLGSPQVFNTVVIDGQAVDPSFINGVINLDPVIAIPFLRGDANSDGFVDIADGVWILYELFLDGPQTSCFAAKDANMDGGADQSDAVYLLNYIFLLGPVIPAPFPECGISAGEECESSSCD